MSFVLGNISKLEKHSAIIGGDQLTRVRLQGAKHLRALAPEKRKRFEHLFPIVCEMWHIKQDLLHVRIDRTLVKNVLTF